MLYDDEMPWLMDDEEYQEWLEESQDLVIFGDPEDEYDEWMDECQMYEDLRRGG